MGFGLRRSALACAVLVVGLVAVGVGSAGPRTPVSVDAKFEAFPGPARVSYGENIAYRASLSNTSGSTLTHVIFRQTFPVGASVTGPVESSCPAGASSTILNPDGTPKWWACDFGQVSATAPDPVLVVVWNVPASTATENCKDCFSTSGFWSVKEGLNDNINKNDEFGEKTVTAVLLSTGNDASETRQAGGYETGSASCDDPTAGSLRTKQKLTLDNPVSTTVCLPAFQLPSGSKDLGYVTTITETLIADTTTPNPRHSEVCVAKLGATCPDSNDPSADAIFFTLANPLKITHVFRVLQGALPKNYTITQVSHNGTTMDATTCSTKGDCVVSIDLVNVKGTKIWVIVVTTGSNGYFDW
jgi:uncharacterized repeat protein (TIGR01451 family)